MERYKTKQQKISVVIPCLNEKATIKRVLADIRKNIKRFNINKPEIIISDNGSTDGTLQILRKYKGIRIVNVPIRGYGAALHYGILAAKNDYVIFADADLSYPFSNLKYYTDKIKESPDMVLGSRLKGVVAKDSMPFLHKHLGTPVLSFLIRLLYKVPTSDCNSGMRMVKKSFYKKLHMTSSGMEWASELLIKTGLKNGKYVEVPIKYKKDKRGRSPHLSTWPDGWKHLKAIILLRPSNMFPLLFFMLLMAVFFYNRSFGLTFLFLNLSAVLFLSYLTLTLLESVIEGKPSVISNFLSKFLLVPSTLFLSLIIAILIFVIPDIHLGTKLFLDSLLGIIFMWIFLIETIKTHLVNKLPR